MSEVCPFQVIRPAVSVSRYAAQLVPLLLDPDCSYRKLDIPPLPQKVQEQGLTPEQQSKYKSDAAFAIHGAHWAKWLRGQRQQKRLRRVPYVDKSLDKDLDQQKIVDTAMVRYGRALRWLATEHRSDPELSKVRKFRRQAMREDSSFSIIRNPDSFVPQIQPNVRSPLWNDDRRGRGTFIDVLRSFNKGYFESGLFDEADEANVLRNSMPGIRAQAVVPAVAATAVQRAPRVIYVHGQPTIGTDVKDWPQKFAGLPENEQRLRHQMFGQRTNNVCPLLPPIRGYSDKGAIELQLDQMLDILKEQKVFAS